MWRGTVFRKEKKDAPKDWMACVGTGGVGEGTVASGWEGNLLRASQRALLLPSTPHKHRHLVFLHRLLFRSQGLLPFPGPCLPPPPHRTPFRWGLSFICPSQTPPPGLQQQVGGGGAQEEPPTCRGRQFWQGRWAGISLEPPPRPRIEVGGAGGVQAGGAVIGGNLNS